MGLTVENGMNKMNNDQASSLALFFLGLAICLGAVRYKLGSFSAPDSGLMPFLTGAGICFFSAVGLVHATVRSRRGEGWASVFRNVSWNRGAVVVLALVAYVLLLKQLGFLICTALFIGFLMKAIIPQRWPMVLGTSLITALASYALFELWLQAQLPKGFLGI